MCHGIRPDKVNPLTVERLDALIKIASDLGFHSVDYDELAAWRKGSGDLPSRPIMLDFDHAVRSMRYEVSEVLDRYGYKGNLFIYTAPLDPDYAGPTLGTSDNQEFMTWSEIRELVEAGWHVGAHTVSHPNLSELSLKDQTGRRLRDELDRCNEVIQANLGFRPKDFAFTGISWSSIAEKEVKKRYRFGRLWITGSKYKVDGKTIRYADLVGAAGVDEEDGGPPGAARYITRDSDPYRLPSMEFQALIYEPEAFRLYLEGALEDDG